MLRALVPCGLATALLVPHAHAAANTAMEVEHSVLPGVAAISSTPRPAPAPMALAQSHEMQAHGGHGDTSSTVGELVIEKPWARESVTRSGAVYLTVRNGGDQDDRLVGVSSDVAEKAELHESTMQDGVMKMRPVEALDVPAQGEAMLAPGGLHVMLMGLKAPLEQGQSFPLTLHFEKAGKIQVMMVVEDIGYAGGDGHQHHHGN